MENYEKAIKIFEYILKNNTLDHIRLNEKVIDQLKEYLDNNIYLISKVNEIHKYSKSHVLRETHASKALDLLAKINSDSARHGKDVGTNALEISGNLIGIYPLHNELESFGDLHDFGKIIIPSSILYKEILKKERLTDFEKEVKSYGHTLLGETLMILGGLHPGAIYATACHHDKHENYPYPHKKLENVIETPFKINPEVYNKLYNFDKIKKETKIIQKNCDIVTVADIACSLRDPRRKSYDPYLQKQNKHTYTDEEIYDILLRKCEAGIIDQIIVKALMQLEKKDKDYIKEMFKRYELK